MGLLTFTSKVLNKLLSRALPCAAVIPAAGLSARMNGEDKLFFIINGKPVIVHTLLAFQKSNCIKEIIIVTLEQSIEKITDLCKLHNISKVTKIIVGGSTRAESVLRGISAVSAKTPLVAIHDAARPCIDNTIINSTINMAIKYKAAAPGIPITSTVKRVKSGRILETINRDDLVEIQTPQVFDTDLIKGALTKAMKDSNTLSDDCMAVEQLGVNVYVTTGSINNIKLTNREDIKRIDSVLAGRVID